MESAILTVVKTYMQYSGGKDNLNKKSFQKLVSKQLSSVMEDAKSSSAVQEMQQGLDDNQDDKISFPEYLKLIGYLANSLSQSKCEGNADQQAN